MCDSILKKQKINCCWMNLAFYLWRQCVFFIWRHKNIHKNASIKSKFVFMELISRHPWCFISDLPAQLWRPLIQVELSSASPPHLDQFAVWTRITATPRFFSSSFGCRSAATVVFFHHVFHQTCVEPIASCLAQLKSRPKSSALHPHA